jgi:hypothetical protein
MSQPSLPIESKGSASSVVPSPSTKETHTMTTSAHVIDQSALDLHAALIAKLTAAYGRPTSPTVDYTAPTVVVSVKRNALPVPGTESSDGSCAAPIVTRIASAPLPSAHTLDAKGYIVAMRRAATRDARIAAIAGYVGYDTTGDYATQEFSANTKAQQALRGAPRPLARPVHSGSVSVAGFIAGMPDQAGKRRANLEAQERDTVEAIILCETHNDHTLGDLGRAHLASIRAELASL